MATQFKIKSRVSGEWAKKVDLSAVNISEWTKKESEAWKSKLPEIGEPPAEGVKASTEESVA